MILSLKHGLALSISIYARDLVRMLNDAEARPGCFIQVSGMVIATTIAGQEKRMFVSPDAVVP